MRTPAGGDGAGMSGDTVPSPTTSDHDVAEHVRENDEHLDRVRSLIAEVDDLLERNLGTAAGEKRVAGPALSRSGRSADVPSSLDLSDGGSPPRVHDEADVSDGGRSDESDDGAIEIEFGSGGWSTVSDLASLPSASSESASEESSDDGEHGREWTGLAIGIVGYPDAGPRRVEFDLDAPRLGGTGLDELRGRLSRWQSESAGELRWQSESAGELGRWNSASFGELFQRRSEPAGLDADDVLDRLGRWNSDLAEGSSRESSVADGSSIGDSLPPGSPRSRGTGATSTTDVSDDIHVTPERTRSLAAELERVDSAYEAERSMEEAAMLEAAAFTATGAIVSPTASEKESPSAGAASPTGCASGEGRSEGLACKEEGSAGSGREALVPVGTAAAAADFPGLDPVAAEVRGEASAATEGSYIGEVSSGGSVRPPAPSSAEIAAAANGWACRSAREEHRSVTAEPSSASTVSDLASSVATPLEDGDGSERSHGSQVWTGHGISIDLNGAEASDGSDSPIRGESSGEESAENLAGDEQGPGVRPPSMPSTELPSAESLTDGQPFQRRHTTGSTASALGGPRRKKVGEVRFGRPTRMSLDDIHRGAFRRQRSFPPCGSGGTAVRSVLIYPPVVVDDGDGIDKSPTLEWARRNAARGDNTVEYVRRDSPPEPADLDAGRADLSGRARDGPDEETGGTAAVEGGSGEGGVRDVGPASATAPDRARGRKGRRRRRGCALALLLVAAVSASLAGAILSGRPSGEPDAVAAIGSAASLSPSRAPATATSGVFTAKPSLAADVGLTTAPIINPTISPTATPTIQSTTVEPSGAPSTNAPEAIESTASPSPSPSRAPTTTSSKVFTTKPSLAADVVFTSAPINNPTISPTATPTIRNTTAGPPGIAPSTGAPEAIESAASPSTSRAPTTTASVVFTTKPSLVADVDLTTAPINNPTISPSGIPTIQSTTAGPSSMTPSTGAPKAIESAASPSPSASRAPTMTASVVFTTKPSLVADIVVTTAPINNPTISPSGTPTIQSTTVEPSGAPFAGVPETNGPTADQGCQLVTIRVEYDNASIIGWTLVETSDNELLFDEGTYVDSFYSSDPNVAGQPRVTEDCLKSGSYRWFTYGDGEGSYSLDTHSGTLVEGTVEFHGNVAFVIP